MVCLICLNYICSQFNPFVEGNGMHYWPGTTATYMYVSITLDHNEDNKIDFDIKKEWTLRMEKYMEQRTGSVQFHAIHPK